jgi:streptogramin lyase
MTITATATEQLFFGPAGVDLDREGNLYVADDINNAIRKVSPASVGTTLAGSPAERDESGYPKTGFVDGFGSQARFNRPFDVAVDSAGNVFVADRGNNAIRKITPAGEVSTFTGGRWGFMDGAGTNAQFRGPSGIAVDAKDILYVAVMEAHTIRKITDPLHSQRIRVVTCEMMPLRLMRIRECEA